LSASLGAKARSHRRNGERRRHRPIGAHALNCCLADVHWHGYSWSRPVSRIRSIARTALETFVAAILSALMEPFVRIIEALAWPSAVVLLAWLLRNEIRGLLRRIESLKVKDLLEADFREELLEAEELAGEVAKSMSIATVAQPSEGGPTEYDRLVEIAHSSPKAAIQDAYRLVERAAIAAGQKARLKLPRDRSAVPFVVRTLIDNDLMDKQATRLFNKMRDLRNRALHEPKYAIDSFDAERFIELALRMEEELFHLGNALARKRDK
jgi:hypothetical protein